MRCVIYRSVFFTLLILLCVGRQALAKCGGPNKAGDVSITLPSTLTVPRNASPGSSIWWGQSSRGANGSIPNDCINAGYLYVDQYTPIQPFKPAGGYANTLETGVKGIGMRIKDYNGHYLLPNSGWGAVVGPLTPGGQSSGGIVVWDTWTIEFIVTGAVDTSSGDTITLQSPLVQTMMSGSPNGGGLPNYLIQKLNISGGKTKIIPTGCDIGTSDIYMPMGKYVTSQLSSPGDTTAPVDFKIEFKGCANATQTIRYQLEPTTLVLDKASSVIALDSTSTAKGVGLQLLDDAGKALPLSAYQSYKVNGAGDYNIPLKARYYRLNEDISGGTANTSVNFSVTYQ